MAFKMQKILSLVILIICFILFLTATMGNEWLLYDTDHIGLWQVCRENACTLMDKTPSFYTPFLDWFSCVRAFMILSCIFTFLAFVLQICNACKEVHFHMNVVRFLMVLTSIFALVGPVVFMTSKSKNYSSSWKLGWTFILACITFIITVAMNVFLYICVADEQQGKPPAKRSNDVEMGQRFAPPGPASGGDAPDNNLIINPPLEIATARDDSNVLEEERRDRLDSLHESGVTSKSSRYKEKSTAASTTITSTSSKENDYYSESESESDASSYTSSSTAATLKDQYV